MIEKCIFLLTDFGLKDYYVSAMKGTILRINPKAIIIDVTHYVDKWNIMEGAFILWQLIPYTPSGSILVGVVDPGVGGGRKEIVIETVSGKYLVGPDNGLLYPAAKRDGISAVWIVKRNYFKNVSSTFHGRDIFAPIAAYLSKDISLQKYCVKVDSSQIKPLDLFNYSIKNNNIIGSILHIDRFGNIITNVDCNIFYKYLVSKGMVLCKINSVTKPVKPVNTFSDLEMGELGIICGSSGLIEIVSNRFEAKNLFGNVSPGKNLVLKI